MEWLQNILEIDKEVFLYLNSFHNDFWDTIMLMVTRKETWLPFYVVVIFYIIKNYKVKALLVIFFLALTMLLSDQISVFLKESFQRLRPVHDPAIEPFGAQCFAKRWHIWFCFVPCNQRICHFYFYLTYFQKPGL